MTMQPASGASSGTQVIAGADADAQHTWSLEWASVSNQVLLINTEIGLPAQNAVREIVPGITLSLDDLNLTAVFVSKSTNYQNIKWYSDNPEIVSVDVDTGAITGITPNSSTTIYARRTLSNVIYEKSYTVVTTDGFYDFFSTSKDIDNYCNTFVQNDYLLGSDGYLYPVEIYKDDGLQLRANCYGYAFRFAYGPNTFFDSLDTYYGNELGFYKQQPGEFANKYTGLIIYNESGVYTTINTYQQLRNFFGTIFTPSISNAERMDYIVQLLQADANTLGYALTEYTGNAIPNAETYSDCRLVAVVVGEIDYHFYMQHSDNTWSHKPGYGQALSQCFDCGNNLTNENIRAHACEDIYSGGAIKFFYITKDAIIDGCHYRGTQNATTQTAFDTSERAGNYIPSAKSIGTIPQSHSYSNIDFVNDIDYYAFTSTTAQSCSFSATMVDGTPVLMKLYNSQGELLYTKQATGTANFTYGLSANTQYYLSIEAVGQTAHHISKRYNFSISAN